MCKKLLQWLRGTPALWLVLAVELLVVGQAVWAALQPPVSGVWTIDQYQQLLPEQTQLDEQGRLSVQLTEYGGEDILLSPVVALTPGHYQFTVSYESRPTFEADGRVNHASLSLHSLDNNMAVRDEWAALSFHRKEQTVTLTVRQPSDAVQMTVHNGGGYLAVGEIAYTQDMVWAWVWALWLLLCSLALNAAVLAFLPASPVHLSGAVRMDLLVLTGITLLACAPLLGEGYIMTGPDFAFHIQRIEGIAYGLKAGQFPVRVYPNAKDGFGYAASLFYGELLLYLPAFLRLLGVGVQNAYNFYILLVTALTAASAFLCWYCIFRRHKLALVGAALHTLASFRLYNVYKLCAVGAYTAMIWLPLVVYGLWLLYTTEPGRRNPRRALLLLILSFSGLLQSHMITLEMTTLMTAVICLAYWRITFRRDTLLLWCKAVAGVVLLNLWFLVPFFTAMSTGLYGRIASGNIQTNGVDIRNLLLTPGHTPGPGLLLGAGLFLVVWFSGKQMPATLKKLGLWGVGLGSFACLISMRFVPWNFITDVPVLGRVLQVIQFPWRYMTIAIVGFEIAALCALEVLCRWERRHAELAACSLLMVTCCMVLVYYQEKISDRSTFYLGDTSTLMYTDAHLTLEYCMDFLYVPIQQETLTNQYTVAPADGVEVGEFTRDNGVTTVLCASLRDSEGYVELPLLYYPGYKVVDGPGATYLTANGMVGVTVPAGYVGAISVAFREPKRWLLADGVSLVTLLAMLVWPLWKKRRRISKK